MLDPQQNMGHMQEERWGKAIAPVLLRGVGQIMLQEHAVTGILFLAGITYGSLVMGAAALLAVAAGTLTAKLLRYDQREIEAGLYGFSAALVGVALMLFFRPEPVVWAGVVLGSAAAAVLQHFFIVRKWPAFTLPFVVVTWVLLFVFRQVIPVEASVFMADHPLRPMDPAFPLRGYGQVIFQGNAVAGLIFLVGVLAASPRAALFGLVAGALAGSIAWALQGSDAVANDVALGLYSFNAVLCGIALAGKQVKDMCWALAAVLLSLAVTWIFMRFGLPQLTFPFVAGTAACVLLRERVGPVGQD